MIHPEATQVPDAFDSLVDDWRSKPGFLVLLAGIVLPLLSLGAELLFHMCGSVFFNPLPTYLHMALVALVPPANLWLWISLRRGKLQWIGLLALLNGAVIGITAFYSAIFIPLLPIGAICVLFYGLGFLILAPPLALVSSILLRRHLVRNTLERPRGLWAGFGCALGLLVLVELPSTFTRLGMDMAASEDAASRIRGIRMLRMVGDEDMMLKLCYAWPTRATDLTGFLLSGGKPVGTEKARSIYYQVLGATFNSRPAPEKEGKDWFGFGRFDGEQGGTSVAGMVPDLSLAASRIDASIDAQAALAYQEWTLEFKNQGVSQAEARAQIELPPEGVVTRLTLWVNGEEREAAFASRGEVRAAYEKVVRARRDPVLVTTQGKDRVLMQCFPVPADGGRMKVRLGITSPLAFSSSGEAHFHPPRFTERNFGVPDKDGKEIHSLWLESTEPFLAPGEDWTRESGDDAHTLNGQRSESWLAQGRSFTVSRASGNHVAWAEDSSRLGKDIIQQFPETSVRAPLGEVTLAIDGSKGMAPYLAGVSGALRRAGRPVRIILAGSDELREFKGTAQEAGNWLERQPCMGGQDNVAALIRARERASRDRQGVVLWITAGQPALLSSPEPLRQGLERQADGPRILALQVSNGPNRLLEGLDILPGVSVIRLSGALQAELESLLSMRPVTREVLVRKRLPPDRNPGVGKRTSGHLARLFAHEEVLRLIDDGERSGRQEATALAAAFQLVTPVSGAVVLENAAQYRDAGLEPADQATVPGIPEPEMIWLALAIGAILLWQTRPWRFLKPGKAAI